MRQPVLSIECATASRQRPASLALRHAGGEIWQTLGQPGEQAADLLPAIETLLGTHGLWYDALEQVVITVGPGTFTGIRIGLSVARMIAFACAGVRLTPLTTLEALAAGYDGEAEAIQTVLRAGKGDVYTQRFVREADGRWHAPEAIRLCRPDDLPDDGTPLIGSGVQGCDSWPDAQMLLRAPERVRIAPREAAPLYIRPPDAVIPDKSPLA